MSNPWTIPFDGITHVCWKDKNGAPQHRKMTREEETAYFKSQDRERYLNELLRI
jgi:hypothetical protein